MLVHELIEALNAMPPEAEVVRGWYGTPILSVGSETGFDRQPKPVVHLLSSGDL